MVVVVEIAGTGIAAEAKRAMQGLFFHGWAFDDRGGRTGHARREREQGQERYAPRAAAARLTAQRAEVTEVPGKGVPRHATMGGFCVRIYCGLFDLVLSNSYRLFHSSDSSVSLGCASTVSGFCARPNVHLGGWLDVTTARSMKWFLCDGAVASSI